MNKFSRRTALGLLGLMAVGGPAWAAPDTPPVKTLKITVLSTMLADAGIGEWGYCALVEVDGQRILFDTGAHPDVVLRNAKDLGVDLTTIETVVLSHNHDDHTGGLIALRQAVKGANPKALATAHVGAGIFTARLDKTGRDDNGVAPNRKAYEDLGGRFVEHDKPFELAPGVWLTGPVPRPNDETNWQPGLHLASGAQDNVPEDSSLIFDTAKGLVVLTGCAHAGVVNICQYARSVVRAAPIEALIGGLHLFSKSDETVAWTAAQLKAMGVRHLLAGHCTGIEATYRLRAGLGLTRATAVVSSVGSSYDLAKGIDPGDLAR